MKIIFALIYFACAALTYGKLTTDWEAENCRYENYKLSYCLGDRVLAQMRAFTVAIAWPIYWPFAGAHMLFEKRS